MAKRKNTVINEVKMLEERIQRLQVLYSLSSRLQRASQLGLSYSGIRDIYEAFGYKKELKFIDYWNLYDRGDIASKVVEAAPDASWRISPKVEEDKDDTSETTFEKAWMDLQRRLNIFHHLHRVDVLSGIGRYGILLLGFDDGEDLQKEIQAGGTHKIVYLQAYKEDKVNIRQIDEKINSPRYGKPFIYEVQLGVSLPGGEVAAQKTSLVHHSRILHVAEGSTDNYIYGTPRMKKCFNRLGNMELIAGSSAEMWYRGAFPGYNFKMDPDAQITSAELATMHDKVEEYMHDMKRYLTLKGVSVEDIKPQVEDPRPAMDIQFKLLSASTGIPARILFGSERGELASSQDEKNWLDKINFRRENYCEPFMLRPFIDHLIEVGSLPKPSQYSIRWPELIDSSELDKAQAMERKTTSVTTYADSINAQGIFPPEFFFTKIMGMDAEDYKQIKDQVDEFLEEEQKRIERDEELLRRQQVIDRE